MPNKELIVGGGKYSVSTLSWLVTLSNVNVDDIPYSSNVTSNLQNLVFYDKVLYVFFIICVCFLLSFPYSIGNALKVISQLIVVQSMKKNHNILKKKSYYFDLNC